MNGWAYVTFFGGASAVEEAGGQLGGFRGCQT